MSHDHFLPRCVVCNESVNLKESNTDEHGRAVHEDCYVSTVVLEKSPETQRLN
jgi:hypothetical protein